MTNTTSWNDFSQQPSKLFEPWLFVWLGVAIIVHKIAYSLWFHPLRHIPGPWSTKICGWYEFYTNIWLDGQWCKTYPDLHKRYGMSQVKCLKKCSPQIFRNGTNFEKDHVFYTCADNDGSIFSLSNRDEHRARRKALSPRFSKKAAEADAPAILNQIKLLEAFMIRHSSLGKSCNVSDLFRAFGVSYYTLA
ncbi:unnamed protein product [Penicillium salamii]|uniref:Cytochrome P450 n=1 Tax=Penicillium salamii TaxID=1612424 RepID=A0A9W4JE43_9EURO|nr:unnamed protein product [Penicillium salamii]CAG8110434.1 unnamed protein product [Penicillium salamii]CAG8333282.1 unnamed protein product [Penicillium salamii]CAG8350994.1 unnamed protein product [Penicillium salamii]CAG8360566.1 unnamed protein product [Penicillium salamii]